MWVAIAWFFSKILDLLSTELLLIKFPLQGVEDNPFVAGMFKQGSFVFIIYHFILSLVFYFFYYKWGDVKFVRELLWIIVFSSFGVVVHNFGLYFLL